MIDTPEPTVPTVAVVIPTHDRCELVVRAARSVAAQTLKPQRVVVVDDGSSDRTAQALESEFPDAELIRHENPRGVSAARNAGVAACAEDWVAFLDSDDEWRPQKLERQIGLVVDAERRGEPVSLVHCEEVWIRRGNQVLQRRRHRKRGGRIFVDCLPLCAISPSATMLRRSVLGELGGFDESLPACEDYALWLHWTARHAVHFVSEPLVVKYGGHDDQLSRRYPVMDRFRIQALISFLSSPSADQLSEAERQAAESTLRRKAEIVANGARKRGRGEEAAQLEAQIARCLGLQRDTEPAAGCRP